MRNLIACLEENERWKLDLRDQENRHLTIMSQHEAEIQVMAAKIEALNLRTRDNLWLFEKVAKIETLTLQLEAKLYPRPPPPLQEACPLLYDDMDCADRGPLLQVDARRVDVRVDDDVPLLQVDVQVVDGDVPLRSAGRPPSIWTAPPSSAPTWF